MAGVIDQDAGFVFIHVPKCAGMSITTALTQRDSAIRFGALDGLPAVMTAENEVSPEVVHNPVHARARDIRTYLGAEVYVRLLSFAVVRNPWDRLSSRYHFFRGQPGTEEHRIVQGSLEEFVVWACANKPSTMLDRLGDRDGEVIVNRILRYESVADDFAALCAELGLSIAALPHRNASANPGEWPRCSAEVVDLVQHTYRGDFEQFGYPSEPPTGAD